MKHPNKAKVISIFKKGTLLFKKSFPMKNVRAKKISKHKMPSLIALILPNSSFPNKYLFILLFISLDNEGKLKNQKNRKYQFVKLKQL